MKKENKITIFVLIFIMIFLFNLFEPKINKLLIKMNYSISNFKFNCEKKDYQAIIFNNEMYLINKKNGKTYKFNETEIGKYKMYSYTFLTQPHGEIDPLGLYSGVTKNGIKYKVLDEKLAF